MSSRKSLLLAAAIPALGAALALARWLLQGSGNVYTDLGRRLYVPDPVLEWRIAEAQPVWLGLDAVGALVAAATIAIAVGLVIDRRERRAGHALPWVRVALGAIGIACLALPLFAFATGSAPGGARDTLPASAVTAPAAGLNGHLHGAPPGVYEIASGTSSLVIAQLTAGGERFEASFSDLRGSLRGDPGDLRQPLTAQFSIAAASVDTGIDMRSKHAREYLQAEKYPRIAFSLTAISGTRQVSPEKIAFSARGEVSLIGGVHPVTVTGTMALLDTAARERLGLGDAAALVIKAELSIAIAKTALAPDAGDFDGPEIPISATLVLTHPSQGTP